MGNFKEEYTKLNDEQRKAVDTTEGTVLVVAGPGTGKTQLLSMRVANIIQTRDVSPSNILCLTFTNKAAINMRDRLIELTDGIARNVMIKTFHGFAAEVMNMFPDHFWNGARLTTAPDVVQDEVITTILKSLPLSDPLAMKFAGTYTLLPDIKTALRLAKEAGLTPDKLEALVHANLAYIDAIEDRLVEILGQTLSLKKLENIYSDLISLPGQGIDSSLAPLTNLNEVITGRFKTALEKDAELGKTTNCGKVKRDLIQTVDGKKGMHKERERNEWWLSLASVYKTYREELHKRGYYDYSDMLVEVISTIEQNPSVRADIQEQFQYVLIDEFQDTNAAQMRLAHLVADHHSQNGNPNLLAVGDDDQSIYKFNGAELANMLSFQKSYPDCTTIVLKDNYRSTQQVLNVAEKIITQAEDRLVLRDPSLSKNIRAVNTDVPEGTIHNLVFPNQAQQHYQLAKKVATLHNSSPQSIAILARNHESLRQISAILHGLNIPVSYSEQRNILDDQIVKLIYNTAALVQALSDGNKQLANQQLALVLRHPVWGINPGILWEIATANRHNGDWLHYLSESPHETLRQFAHWLQALATIAETENSVVIIDTILGLRAGEHMTSPIKQYFTADNKISSDYLRGLSAIRTMLSEVGEYSQHNGTSLRDFVNYISTSIDNGNIVSDESSFVSGENAVELLTVHKAKGLEFDTVFVIDLTDSIWSPSKRGRKAPANLPLQPAFDDTDDYIRLLYVAATRAKSSLYVTTFTQDATGKDVLPTPLIHGIAEEVIIPPSSQEESIAILESSLLWPELDQADELKNLQPILDNYTLSATALLDFLDVTKGGPRYFLEKHLLRLPEATTASMAFGTAMHAALEYAQILTNRDQFNMQKVLGSFTSNLEGHFLPRTEHLRYLEHGTDLLKKLFATDTFWLAKGSLPEQKISDVVINNARIGGKLDRVDSGPDYLAVVDYKTGKPLSSFSTSSLSLATKAWRHKTQLIFYALLLQESNRSKSKSAIKGQMIYLEASQPKELIREYTPSAEDIVRMKQIITNMWPKIQSLNLPDTTNYSPDYNGIRTFEDDIISGKI